MNLFEPSYRVPPNKWKAQKNGFLVFSKVFVCGEAQTMEQSMLLLLFLLFFFLGGLL